MADYVQLPVLEKNRFQNDRNDAWWLSPVIQGITLVLFGFYAVYAVALDFESAKSVHGGVEFISPFFNPDIEPDWWWSGVSPGFILIWAPLGFRATCYYARKVYYRAFFWDPPGCAISEAKANEGEYKGENKLPYMINNLHRYFFYVAFLLAIIHSAEFIHLIFEGGFGTLVGGIGTAILGLDALFLSLYVLSCHSCKHIVGGGQDRTTGSFFQRIRFKSWSFVKKLNINHHAYFWLSLATIVIADMYIRFGLNGVLA